MNISKKTIVKGIISVFLLVAIFYTVDLDGLVDSLALIKIKYLLIAVPLIIPFYLIKAYKWYILARVINKKVSYSAMLQALLVGLSFGIITPGSVGELARITYFGDDKLRASIILVIDKVFDLLAVLFLALLGVTYFVGFTYTILVFFVLLVSLALIFNHQVLFRILRAFGKFLLKRKLTFLDNLQIPDKKKEFAFSFLLSIIIFCISIFQFHFLLTAFNVKNALTISILTLPLIILTNALPISIAGLGVREGAAIILLGYFGISKEVAFNAALLLFISSRFIGSLVGRSNYA